MLRGALDNLWFRVERHLKGAAQVPYGPTMVPRINWPEGLPTSHNLMRDGLERWEAMRKS